jgi:hypothetical protein
LGRGNVKVSIQSAFDDKGVRKAETSLDHLNAHAKRSFGEATKHALGYGAAIIGGAGIIGGLESVVGASIDAEKAQAKLDTQLKAVGISYKDHRKQIDDVITKTSAYSGFLDKDLQGSLSNIVRSTGDLGKSLGLLGLATDIARTKNIGVADAGALIGKIYAGNTRVLKSLGIQLDPVTKAHDKLTASTKHATDEQKRAATAEDKRATAQKAIAALQSKLSGQAEAYGKTTSGSLDKMKAAVDRLEIKLGNALAPTVQAVATAIAKFVEQMQSGQGAGGKFVGVIKSIGTAFGIASDAVGKAFDAISGFFHRNRREISEVEKAFRNLGKAISAVFENVILPVVKRVIPGVTAVVQGRLKVVIGVVRVFTGLLTGNWSQAWQGLKGIVSGALQGVGGTIRAFTAPMREAASRLGQVFSSRSRPRWAGSSSSVGVSTS